MLLSFSVANFRSFREEQTLSMVARKKFADHEGHLLPIPGSELKALPIAIFYGANGAGKSNLVKALEFAVKLIKEGVAPKVPVPMQPFRLGGVEGQPSRFELRFVAGEKVFGYGFELTPDEVRAEWLDRYEGEKARPLFERAAVPGGSPKVEVSAELKQSGEKIAALGVVGVRRNQLFLSAIRETIEETEQGDLIRGVLAWLKMVMCWSAGLSALPMIPTVVRLGEARGVLPFLSDYLREAGTGVEGLELVPRRVAGRMGEEELKALKAELVAAPKEPRFENFNDGSTQHVSLDSEGEPVTHHLIAHQRAEGGTPVPMPIEEQSDGTQRMVELLPFLKEWGPDGCFVVDEIDRSLHPLLAKQLIAYFLQARHERPGQLIVTTHDTHLLDLELLRRDEIWFAEKNEAGATHLYPLADFPVRNDLRVDKSYLQGRFGAIPFLGGIDRLLGKSSAEAAPEPEPEDYKVAEDAPA